ncbi:MAG: hypothetical protein V4621_08105 [Pseudomonadota bacterium]
MGNFGNLIRQLTTLNILSTRKNKAADLRVVYNGIAQAVDFLEGLQRGALISSGSGQPDNADGNDGDAYIDTHVSDMYLKVAGAWSLRLVLRGNDGASAYQSWLNTGHTGTEADFIVSLRGNNGKSAYQLWLDAGNTGNLAAYIEFTRGKKGDDGKSAYQLWSAAGNIGTLADFLASLPGQDGDRGSVITASNAAPSTASRARTGDIHFQQIFGLSDMIVAQPEALEAAPVLAATPAERYAIHYYNGTEWVVIYRTPAAALISDGSVTNAKLATDVKVGSLSAAKNAYPAADRAGLTTVETFLVWIGPKVVDLFTRVGGLDTGFSQLNTLVNGFAARIQALEARPVGGTGTGTGSASYPAQSGATANLFLQSTGAAGGERWAAIVNNKVGWLFSFKNEISREQRFFKATTITRIERDAGVSTLSYSINGATAVNVVFTSNVFTPTAALVFPAGALVTWALTYNPTFTLAAFEIEGTETI